jgi:hypothetical protein
MNGYVFYLLTILMFFVIIAIGFWTKGITYEYKDLRKVKLKDGGKDCIFIGGKFIGWEKNEPV